MIRSDLGQVFLPFLDPFGDKISGVKTSTNGNTVPFQWNWLNFPSSFWCQSKGKRDNALAFLLRIQNIEILVLSHINRSILYQLLF
jgi:hypothetical protein